jgi:Lon protease-like protein
VLKRILAVAMACPVMVAAAHGGSAAAAAPPLSVYGGLPNVEQVEISPDGKLAISVTDGEKRMMVIREAAEDGKLLKALNFGDQAARLAVGRDPSTCSSPPRTPPRCTA